MGSDLIQKKEAQPIFVAWHRKTKTGHLFKEFKLSKVGTTIVGENKQMKRSTI